jgi:hypothetical protein
MPVRTTCSRMRWSYTRRVCDAAVRVLIITKGSPAGHHPPAKTSMILRVPQMRTRICGRSSRAAARILLHCASVVANHLIVGDTLPATEDDRLCLRRPLRRVGEATRQPFHYLTG